MIKRIHSALYKVKSLDTTEDFYRKLGFDVIRAENAVRIIFGDYRFAFIDETKDGMPVDPNPKGVGLLVYFEVDSIDGFYARIQEQGITAEGEPVTQPRGKKELTIVDPDGYTLVFFENI